MSKKLFAKIFILFFFSNSLFAAQINSEVWNSSEGLKRLERSQFKNDFYQLLNFYQPQINPLYCSVASSVMILNALNYGKIPSQKENEVMRPQGAGGGVSQYPLYSQLSFLNDKTDKIKKREIIQLKEPKEKIGDKEIYDAGVSLGDLSKILHKVYKLETKLVYADKNDEESVAKFRKKLKKILRDSDEFIIANFDGKIIKQKTSGHISPLVAYDEESDSVLIMDVALHKNLWYWIGVDDLFAAMNSKDGEEFRGYLIVEKDSD